MGEICSGQHTVYHKKETVPFRLLTVIETQAENSVYFTYIRHLPPLQIIHPTIKTTLLDPRKGG